MKKVLTLLVALSLLGACAAPLPRGDVVTARQLLQEVKGLPFACSNYDAASDTCDATGTYRIRGDRIFFTTNASIDLQGAPVPLEFKGQSVIRGSELCLVPETGQARVKVPGLPREMSQFLEEAFLGAFNELGAVCSTFYRFGPDAYVEVVRDEAGNEVPDLEGTVHYFRDRKRLRLIRG